MKRWKWVLLIFELALFVLILVLPQVELPDFAFHRGTAPIAAKARVSGVRAYANAAAVSLAVALPAEPLEARVERSAPSVHVTDSRLALLCTLLC